MTIREVINFYFSFYSEINISIEMWQGLEGNYKDYTKESFETEFGAWLDEKVMDISFETYGTDLYSRTKREKPVLWIRYE